VVRNIPYVNANREIKFGILVSELTLANDITAMPSTHVIKFSGEHPCHKDGTKISQIVHQSISETLDGLEIHHSSQISRLADIRIITRRSVLI